jgi:hypothetical protein
MKKKMTNGIGMKTKKIRLRGYTSYGYMADINNQTIEFATESDMKEWIGDNDYGHDNVIRICLSRSNRKNFNLN